MPEADADKNGTTDDVELMQWLDTNRPGKNDFQPWAKAQHPTLGEVEVGGWNPKFWSQNPPVEMLETWARNEAMFNLYLAQQLAQVRVVSLTSKPATGGDGGVEVTATVTNEGLIPTALEMAKRVKIVRPDTVSLQLAAGQSFVGGAGGPGRGGRGGPPPAGAPAAPTGPRRDTEIGWLKPGETRTVSWTVSGPGMVTATIGSTRGGVDSRSLTLR